LISSQAKLYRNVIIGSGSIIEDFVIVGVPPRGCQDGELKTVIGKNAVIRSHTVIYAGNVIGDDFQTGNKTNIRELNSIGNNVSIGTLTAIEHHVRIGNEVRIHTQAFVPEYTVIDDASWIGPNVVFTNAKYPNSPGTKHHLRGCHVAKHGIVGANSTILPGVQIGERAMVGAGSVVTTDVPDGVVAAGNPAKMINLFKNLPYSQNDNL
jgi:acetyltransferase-like isoleucine patch superfamily enzyme